jgi:hypothetical protein
MEREIAYKVLMESDLQTPLSVFTSFLFDKVNKIPGLVPESRCTVLLHGEMYPLK